jgi:hypothetical protein
MQKIKSVGNLVAEKMVFVMVCLFVAFVSLALLTQFYFVYLEFTGQSQTIRNLTNAFNWKFDGRFKNDPANINYNADEHVWVESVENKVKIGKLAGNRNLEFGVKNILEEYLQDKEYDLTPNAPNKLKVEIVFLDVLTTKKNVSVFHKNEEEVVIRMKGILYKDGKKEKEILVEESSSEISMSTLIVDQGGQFNQTSLSNALKKTADKLVTKLFE